LSGLGFLEEVLPGADFIPTATIGWFLTYYGNDSPADDPSPSSYTPPPSSTPSTPTSSSASLPSIDDDGSNDDDSNVIDAELL
jgi:hypothetical protein